MTDKQFEKRLTDMVTDFKKKLASQLKAVAKDRSWTQRELADEARWSVSNINRVLHEDVNVTLESICRLMLATNKELMVMPESPKPLGSEAAEVSIQVESKDALDVPSDGEFRTFRLTQNE